MYGLETSAMTVRQARELEVSETKMLRWSLGWTRKDKIRNEKIRNLTGVEAITAKTREQRLRWFGHVKRREEDYVGKRVLEMEIEGRRGRGRQKTRWKDTIVKDMKELSLEEEDVMDRNLWRCAIHGSDPVYNGKS